MTWAKRGAKCVCVARSWWLHGTREQKRVGPSFREKVIIQDIWTRPDDGRIVLRLKGHDGWFMISGFRPLTSRTKKQDVALFASLLNETPAPAIV